MGIKCRIVYNESCLKCKRVEKEMIRIGAYYMCQSCFENEFNVDEIDIGSKLAEVYYKWLQVHLKLGSLHCV